MSNNPKPGSRRPLTRLEKILIANGGPAHRTLRQNRPFSPEMAANSKKRRKPTSAQRRKMEES